MKKVIVIDGQGGRLGQMIVDAIIKEKIQCNLICIGTNSVATNAMLKAGASAGATGENPVVVAARTADVIVGPIGMVVADSLLGEITPKMALSIGQSEAYKLLLPVSHCTNIVTGVKDLTMNDMVKAAICDLKNVLSAS